MTDLHRIRQRLETLAPGAAVEAEKNEVLPIGLTVSTSALQAEPARAAAEGAENIARVAQDESTLHFLDARETPAGLPAEAAEPVIPDSRIRASAETPLVPPADQRVAIFATAVETPAAAPPPAAPWDAALHDSPSFAAQTIEDAPANALSSALAVARDALGAKEGWWLRAPAGATALSIIDGVGATWTRFQSRAAIHATERSVFGVCLTRREVVLVHDTADATVRNYLPAWWRETGGGPRAFVLIPISVGNTARGLVLAGWTEARRVKLTPGQVALVYQIFAPLVEEPVAAV
jgi:hypothetical protein